MAWLRSRRANLALRSRLNRALSPLRADMVPQEYQKSRGASGQIVSKNSIAPHIQGVVQSNSILKALCKPLCWATYAVQEAGGAPNGRSIARGARAVPEYHCETIQRLSSVALKPFRTNAERSTNAFGSFRQVPFKTGASQKDRGVPAGGLSTPRTRDGAVCEHCAHGFGGLPLARPLGCISRRWRADSLAKSSLFRFVLST